MTATVWGLEIGATAIRAVKVCHDESGPRIQDFILQPCTRAPDKSWPSGAQEALKEIALRLQHPVYMAIPASEILYRSFRLPQIDESKLEELIRYEAEEHVPFDLELVELRWQSREVDREIEAGISVIRKETLARLKEMTDACGLNVQGIIPSFLALQNFLAWDVHPDAPVAVVQTDGSSGEFFIFEDDDWSSAAASIDSRGKPSARLSELVDEISLRLDYWHASNEKSRIREVYLFGALSKDEDATRALKKAVHGVEIIKSNKPGEIEIDEACRKAFLNHFSQSAVAIGLALQGVGLSPQKINFAPPQSGLSVGAKRIMLGGMVVAAMILLSVLGSFIPDEDEESRSVTKVAPPTAAPKPAKKKNKVNVATSPPSAPRPPVAAPQHPISSQQVSVAGSECQKLLDAAHGRCVLLTRPDGTLVAKRGYMFSFSDGTAAGKWVAEKMREPSSAKGDFRMLAFPREGEAALVHKLNNRLSLVVVYDTGRADDEVLKAAAELKAQLDREVFAQQKP